MDGILTWCDPRANSLLFAGMNMVSIMNAKAREAFLQGPAVCPVYRTT